MAKLDLRRRMRQAWSAFKRISTNWRHWLVSLVVISLVGLLAWALVTGRLELGFREYIPPAQGAERAKTLWDILDLLIIPIVLALAALWYDRRARDREQESELDRSREIALQTYLDRMTELIEDGLHESEPGDVKRSIARARTLTVLRQLDGSRKGLLLQFLYESLLIGHCVPNAQKTRTSIIRLDGADLSGIILPKANLRGVNLPGANLEDANLEGAFLGWADLSKANLRRACLRDINIFTDYIGSPMRGPLPHMNWLSEACMREADLRNADLRSAYLRKVNLINAKLEGADLTGADLSEACLRDATVSKEQLAEATSLEGATLPDSTVHE